MSRSLQLKIEQAVRNRRKSAPEEFPISLVIEEANAQGIDFELWHEEERDFADTFPGGEAVVDQYPISTFRRLSTQLESWPVHAFTTMDTSQLLDVAEGRWLGDDQIGMKVLADLIQANQLSGARVATLSDIVRPILVLSLDDFTKIGQELFSTFSDLYILDLEDRFLIHFCRHGKWAFGRKKDHRRAP